MNDLTDAAIVALVPAIVELAKRSGLPVRYAGPAAVLTAILLEYLRVYAITSTAGAHLVPPLLSGLIAGLAACGLYAQTRRPNR